MTDKAQTASWDDDEFKPREQSEIKFVKIKRMELKQGKNYVRLFGKHVKFFRHWKPFDLKKRPIITSEEYGKEDPARAAGFYPRLTFAIHVIDRADGEIKILEKGGGIFEQLYDYKKVNNINPAHPVDAPDFCITVKGTGLETDYKVTALAKPSPLTEEEKKKASANKYNLEAIYAPTPLEVIKQAWAEIPAADKIKPKKEEKKEENKDTTKKQSPQAEKKEVIAEKAEATDDGLWDEGTSPSDNKDDVPF